MSHISFKESIEILENNLPKTLNSQKVFLDESLGRILAKDIKASFNNPAHKTSAMDGYAIKYEDIDKKIKIIGSNPAGSFEYSSLKSEEAIKTFTGSFIPEGADTLVPIENIKEEDGYIIVTKKVEKNFSIREIGEDFKKDEVLIKKGKKITFAEIGVMASLNISTVDVIQKPVISVIATGSEILDLGEEGETGQIRSSNNYTLTALANQFGFEAKNLGIVKDDENLTAKSILEALKNSDIVVTTGGVSVGDYDYVKNIVNEETKVLFHGVNIKPGQWIMIGKVGEKYIISLPGFPYSSFVTFLLYVYPIAASFAGMEKLVTIKAKLKDEFKKKFKKTQFVAVNIDNNFIVDLENKKSGSSGILTNLVNNYALMYLEEGLYTLEKDSEVDVIIYDKGFLK